ncbi:hypothetical protein ATANTOWER_032186 [Ataeniobius toweri]|uniref:Uncharacterized protein n=1 Tax=Ataeniobius toweri TaxID=208326 RepID=A0ABU7A930_9TELE|nr:hypothetical protein [Ataeniobius toweri]
MFLDCGRKPEYPLRTHACTGRTCRNAERPPAGNRTQDLLAARQTIISPCSPQVNVVLNCIFCYFGSDPCLIPVWALLEPLLKPKYLDAFTLQAFMLNFHFLL